MNYGLTVKCTNYTVSSRSLCVR